MRKTTSKRPATITDIARIVGVSASAVSVALSGKTSTLVVGAATKARIQAVAKEVGYVPNLAARGLVQRRSNLIGLLGLESYFVFALDTLKGVNEGLNRQGYALLTAYDGDSAQDQLRHLGLALSRNVDGLIIAAAPDAPGSDLHLRIAALRDDGFPLVQLYRRILDRVPLAATAEHAAGHLATRHLLELGHRRIVHVTHHKWQDRDQPGNHRDARERAEGYAAAMAAAGLEPRILAYQPPAMGGLHFTTALDGVVDAILAGPQPATAAVCYCDHTALGLIQHLQSRGIVVPDQMSVIGYDGIEAGAILRPGLTTLRQPLVELGRAAAEMVLAQIAGTKVTDREFQPELLRRSSTAPPGP